jgi:2-polyprenyl-3-methyl-5-hydroxy-6-metoxy-1,4-benzoquinol methylase
MQNNFDREVIKNRFGYYELENKPSEKELENYYSKHYYQKKQAYYHHTYSDEEIIYFNNKISQKYSALLNSGEGFPKGSKTLLDVGAGEGFTLSFFKERGWEVQGLDYSTFGCNSHNPECLEYKVTF